jgi:hypothetical protein
MQNMLSTGQPAPGADPDAAFFAARPHIADSVKPRIRIERAVIRKLVQDVLGAGAAYTISVFDGEEWALKRSRDEAAIMDAIMATDMDELRVREGDRIVGRVSLVYGNDGHDVIADHTDNEEIRRLLVGAEALADKIAQEGAA